MLRFVVGLLSLVALAFVLAEFFIVFLLPFVALAVLAFALIWGPSQRIIGNFVINGPLAPVWHIGQAVMGCGGTIDYLVDAVFNYPTLAESYKVAALDATNKMREISRLSSDLPV